MKREMTKRRMIYVGTIVGALSMLAGFAAASITLGGPIVSSSQGTTGTTLTPTAWGAQSVNAGFNGSAAGCGQTVDIDSSALASGYVSGVGTSANCHNGDLTEEIVYTASVPAGTAGHGLNDTFTVYSNAGSPVSNAIWVNVTETGVGYTATFDLYVDYGTMGSVTIDSLNVAINGQL